MSSESGLDPKSVIAEARDELIALHRHYRDSLGLVPTASLVAIALDELLKSPQLAPSPRWLKAEEVREPGYYWVKRPRKEPQIVEVVSDPMEDGLLCFEFGHDAPGLMDTARVGSIWQRIPEPELPREGE